MSGAHTWSLTPLSPQEAEKNAKELVAEEERMKKKAEKKKLKKKVGVCRCGALSRPAWSVVPAV